MIVPLFRVSKFVILVNHNIDFFFFTFIRCAAILSIVIRVLQSSLAASRSQLSRHQLDGPVTSIPSNVIPVGGLTSDVEREELRSALIAAQESAAIQILLESCLEMPEDRVSYNTG